MVLGALFAVSGCTSYSATARGDAGQQISQKSFHAWPLFFADRTVYERGVLNQGETLFVIKWCDFHTTTPKPRKEAEKKDGPAVAASATDADALFVQAAADKPR